MKKTEKKRQILLKRYAPLLPIAVLIYTLLYVVCGIDGTYIGVGFWAACLYAFMMRFCDDIADYEKDVANGKAPIKLLWLSCGATAMLLGVVAISVILKLWWLLMPCAIIVLPLAVGKNKIDWIKPLFTPAIMLAIALSVFEINIYVWILAVLIGVADGILILVKRK